MIDWLIIDNGPVYKEINWRARGLGSCWLDVKQDMNKGWRNKVRKIHKLFLGNVDIPNTWGMMFLGEDSMLPQCHSEMRTS